jgi:hypothetical protein
MRSDGGWVDGKRAGLAEEAKKEWREIGCG